ncbi:MAG: glycosyltransferase family 2 protein [Acidobacteriia bacterium]|nr:glycosyltransferase family 2 protein [Terriglobia bacterium]
MTLSVCYITLNEEANLPRTLESVRWADEIIIVDNGSTDRTLEIARSFGAKVFTEPWKGYAGQRNSAHDKATSDWILSLGADEEVSPELAGELRSFLKSAPQDGNLGYEVPRKNIIFGRWLRWGGNWPDYGLRLFRRGQGRVMDRAVHETVHVDGPVGRLRGALIHHAYPTIASFTAHMERYSTLSAEVIVRERKQTWFWFDVWLRPVIAFKWDYFFRLGFLDGREGFLFHLYHALYVSWKYAKAWELTRNSRNS